MSKRDLRIGRVHFHLMLSLSQGPRHGYAMMQEIEDRTSGKIKLGPSSLYYSLARLAEEGLIAESDPTDNDSSDPRRRYYELTEDGRKRLQAEADAMAEVVAHARAVGVVGS
jgi:DNA-binding PadR family transcriptional regulator